MAFTVKHDLDPIHETIQLLYYTCNPETHKKRLIMEISEAGVNGEDFYQKYFTDFEKYIRVFQKNKVVSSEDYFYFQEVSADFYRGFTLLFMLNRELINTIDKMTDSQLLELVFQNSDKIFSRILPDYSKEAEVEFLNQEQLTKFITDLNILDSEKWKIFMLLNHPHSYYSRFAKIIRTNLDAFEKAAEAIRPAMEKNLQQYEKLSSDSEKLHRCLENLSVADNEVKYIFPSMVASSGAQIIYQNCYFGLLAERVLEEFGLTGHSRENLMNALKLLSEQRKFEILSTLRSYGQMYSTEIAVKLGVNPNSISHHLSSLLDAGLIKSEKLSGKIYYNADEAAILMIIEQLRQLIL